MRQGLILGKFMPPTIGHKYLIDFAINYAVDVIDVVVASQPTDRIRGIDRVSALIRHYEHLGDYVNVWHLDEVMPQEPSDHPDFWGIWKRALDEYIRPECSLCVFASEAYGVKLAEVLDAEFIPVDLKRQSYGVTATAVRAAPNTLWHLILPEMREYMTRKVTIFGAESCGKSIITGQLADWYQSQGVPEYARGYLDIKGSDLSVQKMWEIGRGQCAQDRAVLSSPRKQFIIRDTDLLTTIGYSRLFGYSKIAKMEDTLAYWWSTTKSDLYLVLDTDVPFIPDSQRYGGHQRQTTTKFWVDLLEKFGTSYEVVSRPIDNWPKHHLDTSRRDAAVRIIDDFFAEKS